MIYELDGQKPDLPEEGRYWVAPSAERGNRQGRGHCRIRNSPAAQRFRCTVCYGFRDLELFGEFGVAFGLLL